MIRTTGAERLSRRLRKFVKENKRIAATCGVEAAREILIPFAQDLFDEPPFTHIWKGRLVRNLKAFAVYNTQYPSVEFSYGRSSTTLHAANFESGGPHGDWPFHRMWKWVFEKWNRNGANLTEDEAKAKAQALINRFESGDPPEEWNILGRTWESKQDEWFQSYRDRLALAAFGNFPSAGGDEVPF